MTMYNYDILKQLFDLIRNFIIRNYSLQTIRDTPRFFDATTRHPFSTLKGYYRTRG